MATFATRAFAPPSPWLSVIRAMSQTGGASLLSALFSLVATKIIAVTLGPVHLATLSTLQQLRQAAVGTATLTGQTALVQGASSTTGSARRLFLRTTLCLLGASTAIVAGTFIAAPAWIARQAGLPAGQHHLIALLGGAVAVSAGYVFLAALLNSAGAIGPLAMVQLAAPAAMALLAFPVARAVSGGNTSYFVALLTGSSLLAVAAASWVLHRERRAMAGWFFGEGAWWDWSAARRFLAISGSMFLSALLANWALIAVRARILQMDGLAAGGHFDAAWAISMNQAGLILASMQTYYLPTLAGNADPAQRSRHIERVLTVAAAASAVLIAGFVVFKPQVLTLLYSNQFSHASQYLRWTLLGDYLKITSWILSIPLIASADMRAFLAADLVAYGTFVTASVVLNRWFSAGESASIGFVLMYAAHLIFCGTYLIGRGDFRPRWQTVTVWLTGLAAIGLASALFWIES